MTIEAGPASLAARLLAWHDHFGRHDLPWQRDRSPYRVWISEIMLQQTQVATVIRYFERFIARFPDVGTLAAGPIDEVLHLWSGLGYYARARNLHRAAGRIRDELGGEFPRDFDVLVALPGIGRSTAGAILALACDERHAILDGNVKRVLARHAGVAGSPAERAVEQRLWAMAEAETPHERVATYTQAIMDLGATVCVRRRPLCAMCPIESDCVARLSGRQHALPEPRAKSQRARRVREVVMLVAQRTDGAVLLERRPSSGIWGGLWCLPEFATESAARAYAITRLRLDGARSQTQALGTVPHAFTHFDLVISPLLVQGVMDDGDIAEVDQTLWYDMRAPARVGLPAPIQAILESLT